MVSGGSRPCESGHVPGTAAADIGLIDTTDRDGLEHDFHAVPEGILRTGHHDQMRPPGEFFTVSPRWCRHHPAF